MKDLRPLPRFAPKIISKPTFAKWISSWSIALAIPLALLPSQGAEALTIGEATSEALSSSPDIKGAEAAKSETEWRVTESIGSGFLPKVNAGAHHYLETKYSVSGMSFGGQTLMFPGLYPTDAATLDFKLPLFDGLNNVRSLQAARLSREAAEVELSFAEFSLKESVRLAFYKALAAVQLQSVANENVNTLEDHMKQISIRKRGGVATNYDVLRVQVQLSEAQSDLMDANDNAVIARNKLTSLLGKEQDTRALEGTLPTPDADANRIGKLEIESVATSRGDIQAKNLRAQAAGKTQDGASNWYIPSVALQGEYMLYNQQFFATSVNDSGNYQNAYSLGIFLNWNLFDGGVSIAREREAAYKTIQAEQAAHAAKIEVPYDTDYWKRRYVSNSTRYVAKQLDIKRSEESVRLSKQEEKAGTRTSSETLDAELDLFRSRAGAVNALINALEAKIQLEKTMGREI